MELTPATNNQKTSKSVKLFSEILKKRMEAEMERHLYTVSIIVEAESAKEAYLKSRATLETKPNLFEMHDKQKDSFMQYKSGRIDIHREQ